MAKHFLTSLLVFVAVQHLTNANELTTCERQFSKIGCYDEAADPNDLVLNLRSEIKWGKIVEFVHHLACECDKATKKRNTERAAAGKAPYAGFALHYWGECYGKTQSQIDALTGRDTSKRCNGNQEYTGCFEHHKECVGHAYAEYVYKFKEAAEKDVNGGYSEWESWTRCNGKCGMGLKVRERTCNNPLPEGKGADCSKLGPSTESASCNTGTPCPVDGEYGEWGPYGSCSKSCGGGNQRRTRSCNNPAPAHGGKECEGPSSESRSCNVQRCPINGGYSSWSSYGSCSRTCGGGQKIRYRSCTNPSPKYDGKDCSSLGAASQTASCNTHVCLSAEYTKRACEGGTVHLSCGGSSRITITHALYGRKTASICGGAFSFAWNKNCASGSSWSKVTGICENKASCSVAAKNSVFGDPCVLTPKYVEVKYRCKG